MDADEVVILKKDGSNYPNWSHFMSQHMIQTCRQLWDYVCGIVTEPNPGHENFPKDSFQIGKVKYDYSGGFDQSHKFNKPSSSRDRSAIYSSSSVTETNDWPSFLGGLAKVAIASFAAVQASRTLYNYYTEPGTELKILSYNVCFREDLEIHKRMKAVGDLIEMHSPDLICFQEVTFKIYDIFQQSSWWKLYRCSVSSVMAHTKPSFCMQVEENICKFAKKGMTPSQIGVILRDSHGIAQVKSVTGSKILRILKAHGLAPEIPEDLYHLIKKAVAIRKHLERNRKDKDSKFRLILVESRIHRLARYYKKTKKLPPVWK
ncbi:40S ribosomal protein S13 [Camellia lanceoleosa]|uniref:40S ribosomal protein S13 n=1 Tax=Camellia lanceoleosa TaxID=1840588 RepID=A0ACC0GJB2_9ERIC|nr:40S ribosomal protein S13 [Camellia lanceoleosa]